MTRSIRAVCLIARLTRLGIQIERRGERLRLKPAAALPVELLDELKNHKPELLVLLRDHSPQASAAHKCVTCDWRSWVDGPPIKGRIRTTCRKCGRFIGYRPREI